MIRAAIMRRLHEMVDQLEIVPEAWFEEGIYPLHKVTLVDKESGKRITLVVGVEEGEEP